ncbi:hypothetical protein ACH42_04985 [Endozoicomonas sp. (ex Bugula neritina AB1)]|nr:hypothetical protein ACH42_04985 [Endozoicomonas sp. (ex Bugula neritina AB1)]
MSEILEVRAGSTALQMIRDGGLPQSSVKVMAGASGGPKWFVLSGLDKALLSEYFRDRQQPLELLGTSAGSWRFSCYAQQNPLVAHECFEQGYIHTRYSPKPDAHEISTKGRALIEEMISDQGVQEIIDNPVMRLNLIAVRSRGLTRSELPPVQLSGLLLAAAANAMSRNNLPSFFHRTLFHHPSYAEGSTPAFYDYDELPTTRVGLNVNNVRDAVMASGSIPMAMEGVRNISGAPAGIYRDGGVTDYHFDLPFHSGEGLVLYPHFYNRMIPGWFDKSWKKRMPSSNNTSNVVLISPSEEFISKLPYGKIPDREDFKNLSDSDRIKYWQTVVSHSMRLGSEFLELVSSESIKRRVQSL